MKKEEFTKHVKEAINLTEDVETDFRQAAFQVALAHLLTTESETKSKTGKKISKEKYEQKNYLQKILKADFDWTKYNIPNLHPNLQNLLILRIVKNEFEIPKLTSKDMQIILSQKFRIHKTPNAISMSLMKEVGKHVSSTKDGNAFYYEITANGIVFLDNELSKLVRE